MKLSLRNIVVELVFFAVLSVHLSSFADVTADRSKQAEISLDRSLVDLKPKFIFSLVCLRIKNSLDRFHYRLVAFDQRQADKIFSRYLERLDPSKSLLLQSDVDAFQGYRNKLKAALSMGELRPAFELYNRHRRLAEKRARYMLNKIEQGMGVVGAEKKLNSSEIKRLKKLQVETGQYAFWDLDNNQLIIERKNLPRPKDEKEQQVLWDLQLLESVITLKLNHKSDSEIIEQLQRRNVNTLRRLHQSKDEDIFQVFMNAYVSIYDPHTQYFSPQTAENFDINMSLFLEGIGAVLQTEDEYTKVVSVVVGGPADKAGQLKRGDKIVGVAQGRLGKKVKGKGKGKARKDSESKIQKNFENVVGMRLDDVVKLIRGKKNTWVSLEVIPSSSKRGRVVVYEIQRDKVNLEDQDARSQVIEVKHQNQNYKIGVINLPTFYMDFKGAQKGEKNYKSTTRDVGRLLTELKIQAVDGVIIDLRGNGGGSLQEANDLSGLFIHEGPTVIVRNRGDRREQQTSKNPGQFYSGPLLVLIDRLSASASEIFAGVIQDYGRGLVIGGQSYGKGTVQTIRPLRNGGQLKLTIGKFYRVSGKSTQNKGIIPDIIFPSLYDERDIGESMLPDALEWDTIKPVSYSVYSRMNHYIPDLKKAHKKRVVKNPDFVYANEMKLYIKKYENIKKLSLNIEKRTLQLNEMKSRRLAIENKLRKFKGETLLNNLEELEEKDEEQLESNKDNNKDIKNKDNQNIKDKDKIIKDSNKKTKSKTAENDAFIKEASVIFGDYIKKLHRESGSNMKKNQRSGMGWKPQKIKSTQHEPRKLVLPPAA